jgi:hypothetical protein
MNYKIAAKGDANGLAAYRHLPWNHAQESHNPPAFAFIDKGRVCAVDPGVCEIELSVKTLKCRRSRALAATQEHPVQIRHLRDVIFNKGTDGTHLLAASTTFPITFGETLA